VRHSKIVWCMYVMCTICEARLVAGSGSWASITPGAGPVLLENSISCKPNSPDYLNCRSTGCWTGGSVLYSRSSERSISVSPHYTGKYIFSYGQRKLGARLTLHSKIVRVQDVPSNVCPHRFQLHISLPVVFNGSGTAHIIQFACRSQMERHRTLIHPHASLQRR